jgi:hypothetical protein
VSDMVKEVDMEVPSLFGRILPHSGQQDSDKDGIKVIADPVHGLPTGVNRIKPTYCREQLNLPLCPIDDDPRILKLVSNPFIIPTLGPLLDHLNL